MEVSFLSSDTVPPAGDGSDLLFLQPATTEDNGDKAYSHNTVELLYAWYTETLVVSLLRLARSLSLSQSLLSRSLFALPHAGGTLVASLYINLGRSARHPALFCTALRCPACDALRIHSSFRSRKRSYSTFDILPFPL
jgi:hypothetical protein